MRPSPFFLLFGRSPRLPVDLLFGVDNKDRRASYQEYMERWKRRTAEAYDIASRNASKSADRGKRQYDKRVYGPTFQVGRRVLVRNLAKRGGPGKIRSYWESLHLKIRLPTEARKSRAPKSTCT